MPRRSSSSCASAYEGYPAGPTASRASSASREQLGRREVHEEFGTEVTKLSLAWRVPDLTHPDVPALDVLADDSRPGRSARLYRRIREEQHLVTSIGAYCYTPSDSGIFCISAELEPDKRDAAQSAIFEQICKIKDVGVDEKEVEKARKLSLAGGLQDLTTMRGQASDLGSNWMVTGNLDFTRGYLEAIQESQRPMSSGLHRSTSVTPP